MMRRILVLIALLVLVWAKPTSAQLLSTQTTTTSNRIIVRDSGGLLGIQSVCSLLGCSVAGGLDGSLGQLFLVTTSSSIDVNTFISLLLAEPGVIDAEPDQILLVLGAEATETPEGLYDTAPVNFYGATVWEGYAQQPAAQIIRLADARSNFSVTGAGSIVAVIDTGVDPNQPVLKNVLLPGYDFTRNQAPGSEMADLTQSVDSYNSQSQPGQVNQSTVAVLDQSTVAVLDGNAAYAAFGHGTMTSGIIHLVAPRAYILPLKAFSASGQGYLSDVVRAIYYAVQNHARVINMSFDFPSYSQELSRAINYANRDNVICVASAGNDGRDELVYPAALTNLVMGVASTSDDDTLSSFSNYGQDLVWVGAPGEGIITTYPLGAYAAGWGTSFSAPFVSGTAALLLSAQQSCDEYQASQAVAHAKWISSALNHGRLDVYQAVSAWLNAQGDH